MGNPTLEIAMLASGYEPTVMSEREKSAHHVGGQGQMAYSSLLGGFASECC